MSPVGTASTWLPSSMLSVAMVGILVPFAGISVGNASLSKSVTFVTKAGFSPSSL